MNKQVKKSNFPIPCFTNGDQGTAWANDINAILGWNQEFKKSNL